MVDLFYFWWKEPRIDLPESIISSCKTNNNCNQDNNTYKRQQTSGDTIFGAVNFNYAGDISYPWLVTVISLCIAGSMVLYTTKFQDTVTISSIKAEFTSVGKAGKYIMFFCSILDEISISQQLTKTNRAGFWWQMYSNP